MSFKRTTFLAMVLFLLQGATFASFEKKIETFRTKMDKRITKVEKNLDKLEEKIEDAEGRVKYRLKNTYGNLMATKNKLKYEVESLSETSKENWDDAVDRIEDMADNIETQIDDAL